MKRLLIIIAVILSVLALLFTVLIFLDLQHLNEEAFVILKNVSKSRPSFDERYQQFFTFNSAVLGALFVSNGLLILLYFLSNLEIKKFNIQHAEIDDVKVDDNLFKESDPQEVIELREALEAYKFGHKTHESWQSVLKFLSNQLESVQGKVYTLSGKTLSLAGTYAITLNHNEGNSFEIGDGFIGECARLKRTFYLDEIPEGYVKIVSGLGTSYPTHLLIIPAIHDSAVKAVFEMAFFKALHPATIHEIESFLAHQSALLKVENIEIE